MFIDERDFKTLNRPELIQCELLNMWTIAELAKKKDDFGYFPKKLKKMS
jgi:hypothetical protein